MPRTHTIYIVLVSLHVLCISLFANRVRGTQVRTSHSFMIHVIEKTSRQRGNPPLHVHCMQLSPVHILLYAYAQLWRSVTIRIVRRYPTTCPCSSKLLFPMFYILLCPLVHHHDTECLRWICISQPLFCVRDQHQIPYPSSESNHSCMFDMYGSR